MSEEIKRLYRSRKERMLGGVCGGLGDYFHTDATLFRILFVFLGVFTFPLGLIAYFIMWLLIPETPNA